MTGYGPSITAPLLYRRSRVTTVRRMTSGSMRIPLVSGAASVIGGSVAGVRSCADASDAHVIAIDSTAEASAIRRRRSGNGVLIPRVIADVPAWERPTSNHRNQSRVTTALHLQ